MAPKLRPHQAAAAQKLRNGCILKGGVGTGKSRVALAYYSDTEDIEKLYIITTARKRDSGDWTEEARAWGTIPVVDSWHNMAKYADVENAFFIFDEQRLVGSGVWVSSFLKIAKANKWILLSATPGDTWLDYIPVFIANGFYKNRTDFVRQHVQWKFGSRYPKVERFLEGALLVENLRKILVEMPYERHTERHLVDVFCDFDRELYNTAARKRWNYLEDRPIRHISELCQLLRRVVNSHPTRIEQIRNLMLQHPRIIIFYSFDYELEILRTLDVPMAEWNGHKHEEIPDTSEWVYLVQYSAGAEAWNCIETDAMMFYSMQYSYRIFEQAQGRIDRLNTKYTKLYYYVLRSAAPIDNAIYAAITTKRDFNETTFLARWV